MTYQYKYPDREQYYHPREDDLPHVRILNATVRLKKSIRACPILTTRSTIKL